MPKIIIGNVDNEHMMGASKDLPTSFRTTSSVVANRLVWLVEDGDILLFPAAPSRAHLEYVCRFKGVDVDSITVIAVAADPNDPPILTFEVLSDESLLSRVAATMRLRGGRYRALPYMFERGVAWLCRRLGLEETPEMTAFNMQGGAEILNSKAEFRRLASGRDIPIPAGQVCSSAYHMRRVVDDLLDETGIVMVKQDFNSGGDGNVVITRRPDLTFTAGAGRIHLVRDAADLAAVTEEVWGRQAGQRNVNLTAEVFHPSKDVYFSDYEILEQGGQPVYLNHGEMRMEPLWVGFRIPGPLSPGKTAGLMTGSTAIAQLAADLGYVGKINFDCVFDARDLPVFVEFNGRCGGTTGLHAAATLLLGPRYMDTHAILTRNKVRAPALPVLEATMRAEGLAFDPATREGFVVMTDDTQRTGKIEYLVAGRTAERAQAIEERVLAVLGGALAAAA